MRSAPRTIGAPYRGLYQSTVQRSITDYRAAGFAITHIDAGKSRIAGGEAALASTVDRVRLQDRPAKDVPGRFKHGNRRQTKCSKNRLCRSISSSMHPWVIRTAYDL